MKKKTFEERQKEEEQALQEVAERITQGSSTPQQLRLLYNIYIRAGNREKAAEIMELIKDEQG